MNMSAPADGMGDLSASNGDRVIRLLHTNRHVTFGTRIDMTTKPVVSPAAPKRYGPDFQLPDPPRPYDMRQRAQFKRFDSALDAHFADRPDVLVCGEGYLRLDGYDNAEVFIPDCVVAFGVDPDSIVARNGYIIDEVGKPPDFLMEVASRSTGKRDYTIKRESYARDYQVPEYWRFDESGGRWHDAPLAGDTLVEGEYVPIPIRRNEDGVLWGRSEVLGLDVCWDNGRLRFYDPDAGRYLPDAEEMRRELDSKRARAYAEGIRADAAEAQRDMAEVQLDSEAARANTAEAQRDAARAQRDADRAKREAAEAQRDAARAKRDNARAQRDAAEAEVERLREMLRRLRE